MVQLARSPARKHSARTTLVAVGFVGLGLPAGALGAAWPSIAQDLHRDTTDLTVALVCLPPATSCSVRLPGVARRTVGATPILIGAAAVSPSACS
jgi:hypothetical protein